MCQQMLVLGAPVDREYLSSLPLPAEVLASAQPLSLLQVLCDRGHQLSLTHFLLFIEMVPQVVHHKSSEALYETCS